MKTHRLAASGRLGKLTYLAIGAIGTVIVWKQCGRSGDWRQRHTTVPAGARTTQSAQVPSTNGVGEPSNDWERLIRASPDDALRALQNAVARDEREAQRFKVYEVRALLQLQRIEDAKALAILYYERWPAGPDVGTLQNLTGVQPAPIIDMDKP